MLSLGRQNCTPYQLLLWEANIVDAFLISVGGTPVLYTVHFAVVMVEHVAADGQLTLEFDVSLPQLVRVELCDSLLSRVIGFV